MINFTRACSVLGPVGVWHLCHKHLQSESERHTRGCENIEGSPHWEDQRCHVELAAIFVM